MSKLFIIDSKQMAKIAESLGYKFHRQKGSHKIYKKSNGKVVTIPFHNEDLGRGIIRKIINDLEITPQQYDDLRKL